MGPRRPMRVAAMAALRPRLRAVLHWAIAPSTLVRVSKELRLAHGLSAVTAADHDLALLHPGASGKRREELVVVWLTPRRGCRCRCL